MNVYVQVFRLKYGKRTLESNIEDYPKAKALRLYYGKQLGVNPNQFTIEPHTTQTKLSDELSHQILNAPSEVKQHLKSLRIITGKTLKDKAFKAPTKYRPEQYERNGQVKLHGTIRKKIRKLKSQSTGEQLVLTEVDTTTTRDNYKGIYYFRSMEHNKGTTALPKDKRQRQTNIFDYETARFINKYEDSNLMLELPDRHDYIDKVKDKFPKYNELFKHVRNTFHMSNNDTKKLLADIKL